MSGGGQYEVIEEISIKVGKWIELSDTFASDSQVGKYENGIKVGRWDIYNKKSQKNLKIGGGMYIQVGGESKKNGIWIELNEQFRYLSQVTLKGFYSAGKKVGKWKIFQPYINVEIIYQLSSGGGSYIEQGSFKFGSWCELSIGFSEQSQVVYVGDYQNGKKVGSWDIFYQEELIGGGQYEVIEEISIKVGKWIELSDNFSDYSQVIYVGEYQNGKKIGRWDIQVRMENEFNFQQMQILYEEVDEVSNKVGRWCELSIGFSEYSKVVYVGDYQNGKKVGRWDIFYKEELIGGGSYVQIEQGSIKNGSWSELDDYFDDDLQYINHGEYRMGKKVGTWIQIDLDYDNYYKETKYDI
ncbi:unnamed protein product [Paramecium sonneborni]|uniref:Uncharacterized protein n=1 Tax=Paramecium sonneborni TaxID=65129 RepID=A0A8S1R893_9CILI|nr:unnamed protein product [Paramecium sonneborni]